MSEAIMVAMIGAFGAVFAAIGQPIVAKIIQRRRGKASLSNVPTHGRRFSFNTLVFVIAITALVISLMPNHIEFKQCYIQQGGLRPGPDEEKDVTFDFPVKHAWVELRQDYYRVKYLRIVGITNRTVHLEFKRQDSMDGPSDYRVWASSF